MGTHASPVDQGLFWLELSSSGPSKTPRLECSSAPSLRGGLPQSTKSADGDALELHKACPREGLLLKRLSATN